VIDMWIRTQDKEMLVNCNNFRLDWMIYKEGTSPSKYNIINDNAFLLGSYSTKERALEVLDEIQQKILSANCFIGDGYAVEKMPPQIVIYEMPKE